MTPRVRVDGDEPRPPATFGRWDQCVQYPRLFRLITRQRADRRTTIEWTVDGKLQRNLAEALALVAEPAAETLPGALSDMPGAGPAG